MFDVYLRVFHVNVFHVNASVIFLFSLHNYCVFSTQLLCCLAQWLCKKCGCAVHGGLCHTLVLGAKALALCVLLLCLAYLLFVRLRTCYAWRVASRNGRGVRAVD